MSGDILPTLNAASCLSISLVSVLCVAADFFLLEQFGPGPQFKVLSSQSCATMPLDISSHSPIILFCIMTKVAVYHTYDMRHLLNPQLGFEINLIAPETSLLPTSSLTPALSQSIYYLVTNQVPFRILYNLTRQMPARPPVRSSRYTKHQVVHLAFVVVQPNSKIVSLIKVVRSCISNYFELSSTIHQDFVQLVIDTTAVKQQRGHKFAYDVKRHQVPLYFLIFYWSGSRFRSAHANLVRDTCMCDDQPGFKLVKNIFIIINEPRGIHSLVQRIRAEKMNFHGRKLIIHPSRLMSGSWESLWSHILIPFSYRATHRDTTHAFAGILHAFYTTHNLTFDLSESWVCEEHSQCPNGVISMLTSWSCLNLIEGCYVGPLSLSRFDYFRTLWFSRPKRPQPFKLSILASPLMCDRLLAAWLLLSSSVCMSLILMKKMNDEWLVTEALLQVFSGLLGKSVSSSGNSRQLLWYAAWLLLVGMVN